MTRPSIFTLELGEAYLTYLRNLTPQGFLFIMSFVTFFLSGKAIGTLKAPIFFAMATICMIAATLAMAISSVVFVRNARKSFQGKRVAPFLLVVLAVLLSGVMPWLLLTFATLNAQSIVRAMSGGAL